jgi:ATPase family associated with various cellular activities (AAA)
MHGGSYRQKGTDSEMEIYNTMLISSIMSSNVTQQYMNNFKDQISGVLRGRPFALSPEMCIGLAVLCYSQRSAIWYHMCYVHTTISSIRSLFVKTRVRGGEGEGRGVCSYVLEERYRLDRNPRFSNPTFSAFMEMVQDRMISQKRLSYVMEFSDECPDMVFFEGILPLTADICVSQVIRDEKPDDITKIVWRVVQMVLKSESNDMRSIRALVDKALLAYNNKNAKPDHNLYYFKYSRLYETYKAVPFKTKKTFDSMFFPEKDELIQRLLAFQSPLVEDDGTGLPHTLGLLFHGKPGTGKTSAIKSIAMLLKRHVIAVPMNSIKTLEQLFALFENGHFASKVVPMHRRMYVFEEIDCGPWEHIVKKRTTSAIDVEPSVVALEVKKQPAEDALTLAALLEVLDGMIEMPGRLIVMTTNHPETLDPAIMRHGRIDMTIEFKELRRADIAAMFQIWFKEPLPEELFERLQDGVFTQAQLGNIFATRDMAHIRRKL